MLGTGPLLQSWQQPCCNGAGCMAVYWAPQDTDQAGCMTEAAPPHTMCSQLPGLAQGCLVFQSGAPTNGSNKQRSHTHAPLQRQLENTTQKAG